MKTIYRVWDEYTKPVYLWSSKTWTKDKMAARQIEGGGSQEDVENGRQGFRDEDRIVKSGTQGRRSYDVNDPFEERIEMGLH